MTAPDVRTAAQAEAGRIRFRLKGHDYPANRHYKLGFVDGAVWGAALVTSTREQIAEAIEEAIYGFPDGATFDPRRPNGIQEAECAADAVLALMHGLASRA